MRVVYAGQKLVTVEGGRCGAERLLHFAAALSELGSNLPQLLGLSERASPRASTCVSCSWT